MGSLISSQFITWNRWKQGNKSFVWFGLLFIFLIVCESFTCNFVLIACLFVFLAVCRTPPPLENHSDKESNDKVKIGELVFPLDFDLFRAPISTLFFFFFFSAHLAPFIVVVLDATAGPSDRPTHISASYSFMHAECPFSLSSFLPAFYSLMIVYYKSEEGRPK